MAMNDLCHSLAYLVGRDCSYFQGRLCAPEYVMEYKCLCLFLALPMVDLGVGVSMSNVERIGQAY